MTEIPLVFIHLSDIHFSKRTSPVYDLDQDLRDQLEIDVTEQIKILGHPVMGILITGDIAFGGQSEEYEIASAWLRKLSGMVSCDPEWVWVVPGNHDVDRSTARRPVNQGLHAQARDPQNSVDKVLAAWLEDPTSLETIFRPQQNFLSFAAQFSCHFGPNRPRPGESNPLFWETGMRLNDDSLLKIRGLNSALISDHNDDELRLILGSLPATAKLDPGVIYMSLCHHPPSWLVRHEQALVGAAFKNRIQVQLFGHDHDQSVERIDDTVRICAGAVHPSRQEVKDWRPTYNIFSLLVSTNGTDRELKVTVYSRAWQKNHLKFEPDGQQPEERIVPLSTWSRVESETTVESTSMNTNQSETTAPLDELVKPERALIYRFYHLGLIDQDTIIDDLGVLSAVERRADRVKVFSLFLNRILELNRQAELWDQVCSHGTWAGSSQENPFRRA